MKKISTYLFLIIFSFSAPSFADDQKELKAFKDYSYDLNDNIINYGWKIELVRKTNDKEIYILNKNNWIMYCVVFFADEEIETNCSIP